jgi:hypothetical protein
MTTKKRGRNSYATATVDEALVQLTLHMVSRMEDLEDRMAEVEKRYRYVAYPWPSERDTLGRNIRVTR